ncbi:hypothetical protein, partial [Oleiphilus sp. HI0079]|uniref:hypothetical protein n=1 Tax=Oleiphilus sp. HI0079 TaxID=1822254 RepID=UPI001E4757DF
CSSFVLKAESGALTRQRPRHPKGDPKRLRRSTGFIPSMLLNVYEASGSIAPLKLFVTPKHNEVS